MIISALRPQKGLTPLEFGLIVSLLAGVGLVALMLCGVL